MKKQTKKNIVFVLGSITLVIFINLVYSSSTTTVKVENASLTVSETSWDLGEIPMSQGVNTRAILLVNDSLSPITITAMETSCMCTTVQIARMNGEKSDVKGMLGHGSSPSLTQIVEIGETITLLVNYDPNAHGPNATGPITRDIRIQTNSAEQEEIKLTFSGNVIK